MHQCLIRDKLFLECSMHGWWNVSLQCPLNILLLVKGFAHITSLLLAQLYACLFGLITILDVCPVSRRVHFNTRSHLSVKAEHLLVMLNTPGSVSGASQGDAHSHTVPGADRQGMGFLLAALLPCKHHGFSRDSVSRERRSNLLKLKLPVDGRSDLWWCFCRVV